jgi:UPF0755 protein
MKFLKWIVVIALGLFALVAWQTHEYYSAPLPISSYRIITVEDNDRLRDVGQELVNKEIIQSVDVFVMWARIFGHDKKMKSGEYGVAVGTTMSGLFEILMSGKSLGHRLVVPEGTNLYEIAQRLESLALCKKEEFIKLATNKKFVNNVLGENLNSLEGYLFPDTYFFTKVDGCRAIARRMAGRFLEKFKKVGSRPGWTRHQIVTLGSIIEKETGAGFERPQISSVFHNRLNKKMRLQTDPTVIYARLLQTGSYRLSISRADLQADHPYNTYKRKGLPPGPISNPGVEALRAAVQPAQTDYLYFVSKNDGTHVFSKNYKDHSSAVSSYQLDPKARAGKSWRDLYKRGVNSEGEEIFEEENIKQPSIHPDRSR